MGYTFHGQGGASVEIPETQLNHSYSCPLNAFSKHQKIYFLWRPYLPDPKDDYILELAVASETKTILTYNIKDFKGINKFGVRAITPRKLLEEIK